SRRTTFSSSRSGAATPAARSPAAAGSRLCRSTAWMRTRSRTTAPRTRSSRRSAPATLQSTKCRARRYCTEMKFGVVVLPGSNCDHDALHVTKDVLGADAEVLWHKDTDLKGADCVIIPGGFAYGDYLRAGALAKFAPIMTAIRRHADAGGLVLGICNGFQVLTEVGLLPGALMRNQHLRFLSRDVHLRTEET